jgi:7-carboxy-7-deazaguanine synthase (Cx14CxxC type)
MKKYIVKEIFYTLQGEGYNAGKAAVFCRFSGCNLWNGKEKNRENAICSFCDTDFVGTNGALGGKYTLINLVDKITKLWPRTKKDKFIVFTGGEPLLQLDKLLIKEIKDNNFKIAIETNGTILPPPGIDWVCVSPKAKSNFILKKANEIKLVYPQESLDPRKFEELEFDHFYIQPLYNKKLKENNKKAIDFVLKNPSWKLSIQSHKYIGVQ